MRSATVSGAFGAVLLAGAFAACGSDPPVGDAPDAGFDEASDDGSSLFRGSGGCVPKACSDLGAECGPQADGCGQIIQCGTCTAPAVCGGGGASKCGVGAGKPACTPKTCTDLAAQCGPQGDGCGAVIQCGGCTSPAFCGGGGASTCGTAGTVPPGTDAGQICVPSTCAQLGKNCGPVGDGCGGLLQCGSCPSSEFCGVQTPNVCSGALADGGLSCVPATCASVGATCGQVGDGCGGLTPSCGTCSSPQFCGGAGPSKCGSSSIPDAGCTGLCTQIPKCDGGTTTTLTGTVWAPSGPTSAFGPLPVPGAVVYIPNGPLDPFPAGATCNQCTAQASGLPLVSTTTGADGTFTLKNVPAGANVPLVVQLGRWRREVTLPNVTPCTSQALAGDLTRLPKTHVEGDIPLIAVSTGSVDALECVFRKMGVADSEFTSGAGTGRIRLYTDNGAIPPGSGTKPNAAALYGSQTELDKFDAVVFACVGSRKDKQAADQNRVIAYANGGGRVFATHFSYVWLYNITPWNGTAAWGADQDSWTSVTGLVDTGTTKTQQFATWLGLPIVNALSATNPPRITIDEARHDVDQPVSPPGAERWITTYQDKPKPALEHYAFNTPWATAPASQCGRVIYSDFHVTTNSSTSNKTFPQECSNSALSAQEKVLAYMMFDLTTCISSATPPPPVGCTPQTCPTTPGTCGLRGDGCGGVLNCGTCTAPQTCGGGGTPFQCGGSNPSCTPKACPPGVCGQQGDGCGGVVDCLPCVAPAYCGGGGANTCGTSGVGSCTPTTCQAKGATCGPLADGCGGLLSCGPCAGTCINNQCVAGSCTPITCAATGAKCGPIGDGCGNVVDCGTCVAPQTCGGGGVANQCGGDIVH